MVIWIYIAINYIIKNINLKQIFKYDLYNLLGYIKKTKDFANFQQLLATYSITNKFTKNDFVY